MFDLSDYSQFLGISPDTQLRIALSLGVALLMWLIRLLLLRVVYRRTKDVRARYQWRKISTYFSTIIALLIIGRIWFEAVGSLSVFLGLLSAGLAIALQQPIVNLAGWVFIVWRRPFEVSDRIEIGGNRGDVIDMRIFSFTMMEIGNWVDADQSTGRVIHVPNGKVFSETVANYSKGFQYIWDEIAVLVTFESDWRKAKRILQEIAEKHDESDAAAQRVAQAAKRFMIYYRKLTPIVYTSVKDSGVMLTIRFLCEPRRRRGAHQLIWEDILDRFGAEDDVDFAYPTMRYYDNRAEGKPDAGGPPHPRVSGGG